MIESVRLRILLVALSGWANRHQLEVIAYLREECFPHFARQHLTRYEMTLMAEQVFEELKLAGR